MKCQKLDCIHNKEDHRKKHVCAVENMEELTMIDNQGMCVKYAPEWNDALMTTTGEIRHLVATEINKFKQSGYALGAFDVHVEFSVSDEGPKDSIIKEIRVNARVLL